MRNDKTTKGKTASAPIVPGSRGYVRKRLRESWQWYLLLLPALIYILIFNYGPMYGILMAFQNYRPSKGIAGSPWVGFDNFIRFFKYPYFWKMIRNTLSITLLSLATFPCAIIFALFLNELTHVKFKKVAQMVSYMPHFLSEVVVVSLVMLMLDLSNGPVNNLIAALGGERTYFMGEPSAFAPIYVFSGLWQNLGWGTILYISALSSVPSEQIEAAKIDGASRFQVMWHINIPAILPTIMITLLMRMGRIMSLGYTKILLMDNDLVADVSNVISTYTYKVGILGGQYSYSTAIGLFNNIINIILLLSFNRLSKKLTDISLF